ncbi:peptidyl-prolyl cis-trans isomerase, binds to the drugs FK506 and rapamycin [Sphaerosporella brunnea]|uniref:peptidylprolyl isomerase n=1 Tax=Sphaerosporella brunnea TaxID=1250544 RepID=A0A5J5ERQ1_9PEZI|nr:peptidyl-prolyl cis-trans isomerase, binds to the drugs FK506 and rapamycin [Sphaerosporella brunnea]
MFRTTIASTLRRPLTTQLLPAQHIQSQPFSVTQAIMGVKRDVLRDGNGQDYPKAGDTVTMHYVGTLAEDGKKFDSSRDRGKPFSTVIGKKKVIKGWDEAVPEMSLGEKARLTITGDYGYGERGFPNLIPPNATLIFEVELLGINDKKVPSQE